jgi:hypothetical protein
MRGTPHTHSLICVASEGIVAGDMEGDKQDAVKQLVSRTVSARLPKRPLGYLDVDLEKIVNDADREESRLFESDFDFNPADDYFDDKSDPRREHFDGSLDYGRDMEITQDGTILSDEFKCEKVHNMYRRLKLANQMHGCCFTCWKYNRSGNKICRFGFPWDEHICECDKTVIRVDRDSRQRKRVRALASRNNGNINATQSDPLSVIAHGGNSDVQYIDNTVGAAEYAASYSSKAEEPDGNLMRNALVRQMASLALKTPQIKHRQRLTAVANAVISATQIGTVQACYFLLGLNVVISSREVINVNALKGKMCI